MIYNWKAALVVFALVFFVSVLGRFLAFKIPALQRMRELNHEADQPKLERQRYRDVVKANRKVGLAINAFFYVAILPFWVTLESSSFWLSVLEAVAILMLFDFVYYLTHRFLFHGKLLRKVHSLHHQARKPTYVDALYVHPLETSIGLFLFLGSIPAVALLMNAPLNVFPVAVATVLFTQLNTINHTWVNLPYFPFKTLNWVTSIHEAHHVDMDSGNYATLTMLYDWMFGTLEEPVSRSEP